MTEYVRLVRSREFAISVEYDTEDEARSAAEAIPPSPDTVVMKGRRGWFIVARARTAAEEMHPLALLPTLGGVCAYYGDFRGDLITYEPP